MASSKYYDDPRFKAKQRLYLVLMLLCYGAAAVLLTAGAIGAFGDWSW